VWISEIMLQQTRVEAVLPYYDRFLTQFPAIEDLAAAAEADVLAAWSGLGYYSRARNLQRAARHIVVLGQPADYQEVLAMPGAGPYTAAAIASIALGLPHAAVDGNVLRVISRLTNNAGEISASATRRELGAVAEELLDRKRPGDFNQAMMELGATVCVPRNPRCEVCPVAKLCAARAAGTERELPLKLRKGQARDVLLDLVLLRRGDSVWLVQRAASEQRLAGFWELPERRLFPRFDGEKVAEFSHRIVNDRFRVTIWTGCVTGDAGDGRWMAADEMGRIPLTTVTKKALGASG
jgi:A/G-specific adenine glycosylase